VQPQFPPPQRWIDCGAMARVTAALPAVRWSVRIACRTVEALRRSG
jgi:hypothetical protein